MRYIEKGHEMPALLEYKALANEDWRPRYEDFHEKAALSRWLAREQGFLCGYCGTRVGNTERDCHNEHVVPQSVDASRDLDHDNLIASCQGIDRGPPLLRDAHCGTKHGNALLEITPLQRDCGLYFKYASSGEIDPSSEPARAEPARRTIETLGLHIDKLRAARAATIKGALAELVRLEGRPDDEIGAYLESLDTPDAHGHLSEFCFAIEAVLLQGYLPERADKKSWPARFRGIGRSAGES